MVDVILSQTWIPVQQDENYKWKSSGCSAQIYFGIKGVQTCWGLLPGTFAPIVISSVLGSKPFAHYAKEHEQRANNFQ